MTAEELLKNDILMLEEGEIITSTVRYFDTVVANSDDFYRWCSNNSISYKMVNNEERITVNGICMINEGERIINFWLQKPIQVIELRIT